MKPAPPVPTWLNTASFYEIYPQSFLDTNGDGIGDLPADASYEPVFETGIKLERQRGRWVADAPAITWGIFRRR